MGRSLSDHFSLATASDDQAGIVRQHFRRKIVVDGKIQGIGVVAIFRPFGIRLEIPQPRLHLDAGKTAIGAQREDISPSTIRQRYFMHR